jgi:heat-inducible transcriptional repressor
MLPELRSAGARRGADQAADALAATGREALVQLARGECVEPFYVGGASRLAAEHGAFATTQGAARLLELLEQQVIVVSLVRELLEAGVSVSIGSENRIDDLHDCSIVVASYEVEGHPAGMVGVLGPTRMNYRHALAAVSAVSDQLGRHLS